MKKSLACAVVTIGLVLGSGGAAMAGEATGNGGEAQGANNSASECAFSGQDTIDSVEGNPEGFDDDMLAMRGNQKNGYKGIQSYGMFVSAGIDVGVNPGMACKGNLGKK
ncbi:hypothetical protein Q9R08_09745 [Microbacterium sp. QXD-8]|uniref:Secreted protein n=1 Tax=Microbacterium psychrotolerans TaxID=3068321 RepID=A0ABU0Z2P3_9MICO|nr:hypothetical protein [Microbacterium sp. QXD-8]MDQ7878253.1 hypothetical protein [Microbacterium sp. QXD-8]